MKKFFVTLALAVMTIAASAQIKSIDFKGDFRHDLGLGAGITVGILDKIDIAPNFNYYFADEPRENYWTIDADFHYNINLAQDFSLYPLVGLAVGGFDKTKLGVNAGAGVKYAITNKVGLFAECKYQWFDDNWDDLYLTLGVNIGI